MFPYVDTHTVDPLTYVPLRWYTHGRPLNTCSTHHQMRVQPVETNIGNHRHRQRSAVLVLDVSWFNNTFISGQSTSDFLLAARAQPSSRTWLLFYMCHLWTTDLKPLCQAKLIYEHCFHSCSVHHSLIEIPEMLNITLIHSWTQRMTSHLRIQTRNNEKYFLILNIGILQSRQKSHVYI